MERIELFFQITSPSFANAARLVNRLGRKVQTNAPFSDRVWNDSIDYRHIWRIFDNNVHGFAFRNYGKPKRLFPDGR